MDVARTGRRLVRLVLLAVVLVPVLIASQQPRCVPIPVEPQQCLGRGEHVFPWDPGGPECCAGLVPSLLSEIDAATGECVALDGAMVCLPCGDGVCDRDEDECSCPEDCSSDCIRRGEHVFPWDPNGPRCCDGLRPSGISEIDAVTGECVVMDGAMVCLACGDGVCDRDEDECSCPEDCSEDCVPAGGSVFPWDPSYGVCCPGLRAASVMELDPTTGECQPLVGGAVCIACGDGICGPGEGPCNCPVDCATDCDGLPEDACLARNDCQGGYAGFCDCTCPGPVGYEGGGCEGCGPDCFLFVDCVEAPRGLGLTLDTSGGFSGAGGRDYQLAGGVLVVEEPFGEPRRCAVELRAEQRERLLNAAGHVDWVALEPSYISPDNPYCCCDQFIYDFRATIRFASRSISVETRWCDESHHLGEMPWDFDLFLDELGAVGREVYAFCTGVE